MGKAKGSFYKSNTSTHKLCPKCGESKSREEYHKDKNRNDGLAGFCKICLVASNKAWRNKSKVKVEG